MPRLCKRTSYDLPHFSITSCLSSCPEMLGPSNNLVHIVAFRYSPTMLYTAARAITKASYMSKRLSYLDNL